MEVNKLLIAFCFVLSFYNLYNDSPYSYVSSTNISVACGNWHSIEIKNQEVYACGANWYGQLGNESKSSLSIKGKVKNLKCITKVACGSLHNIALKSDGTVWTWGANIYGQLGIGKDVLDESVPNQVFKLSQIIDIACGDSHSIALKNDGTVWSWGLNDKGQLGNCTIENTSMPTQLQNISSIQQIAAGKDYSMALKKDGTVWIWGKYTNTSNSDSYEFSPMPMQVKGLSDITEISCGDAHSLALGKDGTVWAWGSNSNGQLGDGTNVRKGEPIKVCDLKNVKSISCGDNFSLALESDGNVWAWGNGNYIGDEASISKTTPARVKNLNHIVQISAKYNHSLAVKDDGSVWAWGNNWKGQLGIDSIQRQNMPVKCSISGSEVEIVTTPKKENILVYKNSKLENNNIPGDERFFEQWGIFNNGQLISGKLCNPGVDINVVPAWKKSTGSRDLVIGILDTGIDINHKDLEHNVYQNFKEIPDNGVDDDKNGYIDDTSGWDFLNDDNTVFDPIDIEEHGTACAGIIAAELNGKGIVGVAPRVRLLPLKFMNRENGYISDVIKAIEYADLMGVKIINCSWGWKGTRYNDVLENIMRDEKDMLFICAAGNKKENESPFAFYPACFDLSNIISVASVNEQGEIESRSNYGNMIDVAAPGVNILTTIPNNRYRFMSGTSIATPFVTGEAALIKSYYPSISATEIADKIKKNFKKYYNLNGKINSNGIINVNNALMDK